MFMLLLGFDQVARGTQLKNPRPQDRAADTIISHAMGIFSILGHTISAAIIDKIIEKKGFNSSFLHVQHIRKGKVNCYSSCSLRSDSIVI